MERENNVLQHSPRGDSTPNLGLEAKYTPILILQLRVLFVFNQSNDPNLNVFSLRSNLFVY